ncbi:hypothetical protein BDR26DRAFT_228060 [Obelidium mucronatum]|nr:hypothetical protein BDR26DRAFT_228060 [Obelidium mucronatum]
MVLSSTQCTVLHQQFPSLAITLGSEASLCAAGENVLFLADSGSVSALTLASRGLTGSLPDLTSLTALTSVDMRNNGYTGDIPSHWATLGAGLVYLNLDGNNLTGTVPNEWLDGVDYTWRNIPGKASQITPAQNYDDKTLQIFYHNSSGLFTNYQTTANAVDWTGHQQINSHSSIISNAVSYDENNNLQVFESSGNVFRYTKSGGVYNIAAPISGFGGVNTEIVTVATSNGINYLFSINVRTQIMESHFENGVWSTPALLNGGGGGGAIGIAAARGDNSGVEVWTVVSGELKRCFLGMGSSQWSSWTTDRQRSDITNVYAFQVLSESVGTLVLTLSAILEMK